MGSITGTTPAHFLDRLQRINGGDDTQRTLVLYVLELTLLHLRFLRFRPSLVVCAAVLMSNEIIDRRPVWPAAMSHYTKLSEGQLQPCLAGLRQVLAAARDAQLQAVREKFLT